MSDFPNMHEEQRILAGMTPKERLAYVFDQHAPDSVLITSSFGVQSAALLHMVNSVAPGHPIHFINTGYLFKETVIYRDYLMALWDLNVIDHQPEPFKHFKTELFQKWEDDPDACCQINKVDVLMPLLWRHDVWISGLMSHQNHFRQGLGHLEVGEHLTKYYPIVDMTEEDLRLYCLQHALPPHPLAGKGFASVGCTHCTKPAKDRSGRWSGREKTECGLHLKS